MGIPLLPLRGSLAEERGEKHFIAGCHAHLDIGRTAKLFPEGEGSFAARCRLREYSNAMFEQDFPRARFFQDSVSSLELSIRAIDR